MIKNTGRFTAEILQNVFGNDIVVTLCSHQDAARMRHTMYVAQQSAQQSKCKIQHDAICLN